MFYTPGTEDYFHRYHFSTPAQAAEEEAKEITNREEALGKIEAFVKSKIGPSEEGMDVDPPAAAAS
jgi:hypothetical protein